MTSGKKGTNLTLKFGLYLLVKLISKCFKLGQLFTWQKKFGEIDRCREEKRGGIFRQQSKESKQRSFAFSNVC